MATFKKTTQRQSGFGQQELGPGTYDVERSLDFTKRSREQSPDMSKQTDRVDSERKDTVSPDSYKPNKEFVLTQSPKYTIGVRREQNTAVRSGLSTARQTGYSTTMSKRV